MVRSLHSRMRIQDSSFLVGSGKGSKGCKTFQKVKMHVFFNSGGIVVDLLLDQQQRLKSPRTSRVCQRQLRLTARWWRLLCAAMWLRLSSWVSPVRLRLVHLGIPPLFWETMVGVSAQAPHTRHMRSSAPGPRVLTIRVPYALLCMVSACKQVFEPRPAEWKQQRVHACQAPAQISPPPPRTQSPPLGLSRPTTHTSQLSTTCCATSPEQMLHLSLRFCRFQMHTTTGTAQPCTR